MEELYTTNLLAELAVVLIEIWSSAQASWEG
jgi:hypothetical protein